MLYLRPSEIFFSQNEIDNCFNKRSFHRGINIGYTLDDLVEGRCRVEDIPNISVMNRGGKWVTADNRRLWVFRNLEKLGKCETVPVVEVHVIDYRKLDSTNGGRTVRFHSGRYADGVWHSKVPNIDPSAPLVPCVQSIYSSSSFNQSVSNNNYYRPNETLYNRQSSGVRASYTPSSASSLSFSLGSASLSNANIDLDPSEIRYTKESIQINHLIENLRSTILLDNSQMQSVDAITVYKVFKKYWVTDGNKRLWAFNEVKKSKPNIRIPVVMKEDKDKFLDLMRIDRPWLTLIDILQSGTNIKVTA